MVAGEADIFGPNYNYQPSARPSDQGREVPGHRRCRSRSVPPGTVRTGPFRGKPMRPVIDRHRALDLEQVIDLVNASAFAHHQGRSLNARLTIVWRHTTLFTGNNWSAIQTELQEELKRFLRSEGIEPAFGWVRERAPGKGAHSHYGVHLGGRPPDVAQHLLYYLRDVFGFTEGLRISMGRFGALTPKMRAKIVIYMLKGFDGTAFRYVGLTGETEKLATALGIDTAPQGIIDIKRCGTSQNIGPAARARGGWRERRDIEALRRILAAEADI